jgi:tetratricopeptide (TPR) repeat protein
MNQHQQRARVLVEQGRYDLAEKELRQALAADPDDGYCHALLALCLCEQEKYDAATDEAKRAIGLAPDVPFSHFLMGRVLLERNHFPEAAAAADQALRLDPSNADHYWLRGAIDLQQRDWSAALRNAEGGLAQNPEHIGCNNLRALALVKLGRNAEAGATIGSALARDPDNAFTHANQGWALLHQRDHRKALEHFREALRLEPGLDFARAGLVEALKAKNPIYGLMLRYFLWMSRLSGRAQWLIILGGFFGYRFLSRVARENPEVAPWVNPVLIAYIAFALMTWIAVPLFNLLLRFSRDGRHALTREDVVATNWVGGLLLPALVCFAVWLPTENLFALFGMIYFGLLLPPVAAVFQCRAGWPRRWMTVYAVALALLGVACVPMALLQMPGFLIAVQAFLWGSFLSGFVANGLMAVIPRR